MRGPPPTPPLFPSTPFFRSRRESHAPPARPPQRHDELHLRPHGDGREDRKSTRLNSSHSSISFSLFFFNARPPTDTSPLPLHAVLPLSARVARASCAASSTARRTTSAAAWRRAR